MWIYENVEEIDIGKAQVTICAHGKRSKLDYNLDRDFISQTIALCWCEVSHKDRSQAGSYRST